MKKKCYNNKKKCCGKGCHSKKETKQPVYLRVCSSRSCTAFGAKRIMETLEKELDTKSATKNDKYDLDYCGCLGYCSQSPNVQVGEDHIIFSAKPKTVVQDVHNGGELLERRILDINDDLDTPEDEVFDNYLEQ